MHIEFSSQDIHETHEGDAGKDTAARTDRAACSAEFACQILMSQIGSCEQPCGKYRHDRINDLLHDTGNAGRHHIVLSLEVTSEAAKKARHEDRRRKDSQGKDRVRLFTEEERRSEKSDRRACAAHCEHIIE